MDIHVTPPPNVMNPLAPHRIPLGCPSAPALSAVSCLELGLVIYFAYGNIHVSMLFSKISPPSPSPTESKNLLYICVSFAVLHVGSLLPYF